MLDRTRHRQGSTRIHLGGDAVELCGANAAVVGKRAAILVQHLSEGFRVFRVLPCPLVEDRGHAGVGSFLLVHVVSPGVVVGAG